MAISVVAKAREVSFYRKLEALERNSFKQLLPLESGLKSDEELSIGELLVYACSKGDLKSAKELLAAGADVNYSLGTGISPLHGAVWGGTLELVEFLILKGADVKHKGDEDTTALHLACLRRDLGIFKLLLDKEAPVNGRSKAGDTPLHWACREGHYEYVRMLLEAGANPAMPNYRYERPLELAAEHLNWDAVDLLLNHKAPWKPRHQSVHSALYTACMAGKSHMAETLFNAGAKFQGDEAALALVEACANGQRPLAEMIFQKHKKEFHIGTLFNCLYYSCEIGDPKMMTLILDNGGTVYLTTREGRNLLYAAARSSNPHIMRILLQHGLDPNAQISAQSPMEEDRGHTALSRAIKRGEVGIALDLLAAGANPNLIPVKGWTPLQNACFLGEADLVQKLLEAGADSQQIGEKKDSCFLLACLSGNLDVVKQVMESTSIKDLDAWEENCLQKACYSGNLDLVKFLLESGAEFAPAKDGVTALHHACKSGSKELVDFLLSKDFDLNAKDDYEVTPLLETLYGQHVELANHLLDKGSNLEGKVREGSLLELAAFCRDPALFNRILEQGGVPDSERIQKTILFAISSEQPAILEALLDGFPEIFTVEVMQEVFPNLCELGTPEMIDLFAAREGVSELALADGQAVMEAILGSNKANLKKLVTLDASMGAPETHDTILHILLNRAFWAGLEILFEHEVKASWELLHQCLDRLAMECPLDLITQAFEGISLEEQKDLARDSLTRELGLSEDRKKYFEGVLKK